MNQKKVSRPLAASAESPRNIPRARFARRATPRRLLGPSVFPRFDSGLVAYSYDAVSSFVELEV